MPHGARDARLVKARLTAKPTMGGRGRSDCRRPSRGFEMRLVSVRVAVLALVVVVGLAAAVVALGSQPAKVVTHGGAVPTVPCAPGQSPAQSPFCLVTPPPGASKMPDTNVPPEPSTAILVSAPPQTEGSDTRIPPTSVPPSAAGDAPMAIQAVSRSNPTPEAAAALQSCGVARIGIEHVAQMGLVASARDAVRYVPIRGVEPELQTDAAVWLVVFSGRIDLGRGYWAEDPVCAVIGGTPTMFEPGPYGRGDTTEVPPTPRTNPTETLPALAP